MSSKRPRPRRGVARVVADAAAEEAAKEVEGSVEETAEDISPEETTEAPSKQAANPDPEPVAPPAPEPQPPVLAPTSATAPAAPAQTALTPAERAALAPMAPPEMPIHPPARASRTRRRHILLLLSFILLVVLPSVLSIWYLYARADDQYSSTLAFSVRSEETTSPLDVLGGLGQLSTAASADSDILYEYIQSQKLVEEVDAALDLRAIYGRISPDDPVFAFDPDGSIEDLIEYWNWMTRISYDGSTQLIAVEAKAFTPQDAQAIAREIQKQGTALINQLSEVARADATRYAAQELALAEERLKAARAALTEFRSATQIIDPEATLEGQMGLVNQLEQQLAEALIEADLLTQTSSSNDPRLTQANLKIDVIQNRIAEERARLAGQNAEDGEGPLSTLVGDYERLAVEREFAETTYLAALSAYDAAVAEAQRQSRYLAAHIEPTLAETAQYPDRELISVVIVVFLLFGWAVLVLIAYSLRDRR